MFELVFLSWFLLFMLFSPQVQLSLSTVLTNVIEGGGRRGFDGGQNIKKVHETLHSYKFFQKEIKKTIHLFSNTNSTILY